MTIGTQNGGRALQRADRPWATAALLLLAVAVTLCLSALLSAWIYPALLPYGESWAGVFVERGPVKLMRRIMVLVALPFVLWFLRVAGSRGWCDAGWSLAPGRRIDPHWLRHLSVGLGLGLLTLGGTALASYALGGRILSPNSATKIASWVLMIALTSAVVSLLEETAVRGFLLQVLERQWSFWAATGVSSLLFAWGHFYHPTRAAFEGDNLWRQAGAVLASGLSYPARVEEFGIRVVCMTLMGGVLCLSMRRFRTIWMAVGLHAGWVFVSRLSGNLGDSAKASVTLPWIGQRADATDGYLTLLLLAALGVAMARGAATRPDGAGR